VDGRSDPLRITCAVPLSAIQNADTDKIMSSISLNTDMSSADSFKRSWQGFLKAYNLMQFLPWTAFGTHDGAQSGVYEHIEWAFAEDPHATQLDHGYGQDAAILLEEVLDEFRDGLKKLFDNGIPLPVVAYELQGDDGEILAAAELAWIDEKCVAILPEQQGGCADTFIQQGWAVIELDEHGQWIDTICNQIKGKAYAAT